MRTRLQTFASIAPIALVLLVASCGYESQSPRNTSLEAGTELKVEPTVPLSPGTKMPGDQFTATLVEPLRSGEQVVAQTGATVVGEVVDVQASDVLGGESTMSLRLNQITIDNGQNVAIETDPVQYSSPPVGSVETPGAEPMPPTGPKEKVVTFRLAESVELPLVADITPAS